MAVEAWIRDPMFDLALLRVPTFTGGLVAAWAISASLFSMLTFLILYMQNVLGYSALQAGVRFLPLTGAIFLTAGIAGRLTAKVPTRWLIAPGFFALGAGLLLMRGITPQDGWTHLLPGFIIAGIGAGFINVPLASTAVGVVEQERAGMASGINATLRQVGIATGVAALGSILAGQIRDSVDAALSSGPLASHAHALADAISEGRAAQALAATPERLRAGAALASRTAFVDALNHVMLIAAVAAFAAAVLSVVLIRARDFVQDRAAPPEDIGAATPPSIAPSAPTRAAA